MSPTSYSIEARAYDIIGLAAHDFWVLRDENANVIGQLHGLATNRKNVIKPMGKIGYTLKFYHFGSLAISSGKDPNSNLNYVKTGQKSKLIYTGTPEAVLDRWQYAVKALPYLNKLEIVYTPFAIIGLTHINSNTAFTLLGKLMNIPVHKFSDYWQPGWRNSEKILTSTQLESMRYRQLRAE
jgi:hypothetical protein